MRHPSDHSTTGTDMALVLAAEADAERTVTAVREQARRRVQEAREATRIVDTMAERRIASIESSRQRASERVRRQVEDERDARLADLDRQRPDTKRIQAAAAAVARQLIGQEPADAASSERSQ